MFAKLATRIAQNAIEVQIPFHGMATESLSVAGSPASMYCLSLSEILHTPGETGDQWGRRGGSGPVRGVRGGRVRGEEQPEEQPDQAGAPLDVEHGLPAHPVVQQARDVEADNGSHLHTL